MTPDGAESGRSEDASEDADGANWLYESWYRSVYGIGVVLFNVLLTLALVIGTALWVDAEFGTLTDGVAVVPEAVLPGIPWFVYVFSVLGALGFVFTTLIEDLQQSALDLIQYTLRLPASLPLGAGVFLFSGVILGEAAESGPLVLGVVFLSGLYVNLAYKQLGALARRFLSDADDEQPAATGQGTSSEQTVDRDGEPDQTEDRKADRERNP